MPLALFVIHTQFCRERARWTFPAHSEFKTPPSAWDRRNPAPKWPGAVVIVHRRVIFEPLCGVRDPAFGR
jgi:hypothetical protein